MASFSLGDSSCPDASLSGSLFPDSVSSESLQSLREDVRVCFGDAFYLRLEDAEKVLRGSAEDEFATFFDVVIRRLKRITSLHV